MKKILYVTTISDTINAFLVPHIKSLIEQGYKVDCAANLVEEFSEELIDMGVKLFEVPFTRNPLDINNLKAFKKLKKLQENNNYDIVHVHTPIAGVYGRMLKLKFKSLKTIYTVHGFHFYKGAPLLNWLIYYPIEKIMANFTDSMITMNSEDYERANLFNVKNVYNVNGVGVDLDFYNSSNCNSVETRKKLNLQKDDFVIFMIAEVNKNKNHKQMIEAVKILKDKGIEVKVICAGEGPLLDTVNKEIRDQNLTENIFMLGYRTDISELITACDVGIMMSYREGLPRSIMEFMSCGKPVIGTNIRGIRDLIKNNVNGYLVDVGNSQDTADRIEKLYKEEQILKSMSFKANEAIKDYSVDKVINQLKKVY